MISTTAEFIGLVALAHVSICENYNYKFVMFGPNSHNFVQITQKIWFSSTTF